MLVHAHKCTKVEVEIARFLVFSVQSNTLSLVDFLGRLHDQQVVLMYILVVMCQETTAVLDSEETEDETRCHPISSV